ncbi:MAG: hypothetical protein WBC67_04950, partial [Candidatus Acidiferrales bacterium]
AGHDRDFLGMLVVPDLDSCRALAGAAATNSMAEILRHENVARVFTDMLESFAAKATGASNRIERAILLEEPPALDHGEITDKGSLNQRAILEHRGALVDELYDENPPPRVLRIRET